MSREAAAHWVVRSIACRRRPRSEAFAQFIQSEGAKWVKLIDAGTRSE
jgi:hypothetical protein